MGPLGERLEYRWTELICEEIVQRIDASEMTV